jgi:integrase
VAAIIRKGHYWYVRCRYYDADGRRHEHQLPTGRTDRRGAEALADEILVDHRRAEHAGVRSPVGARLTVRELVQDYLARADLAPATRDSYRSVARARLLPALGDVLVDALTPERVRAHVAAELASRPLSRRKAPTISRHTVQVEMQVLRSAVRWGAAEGGVAAAALPPVPMPSRPRRQSPRFFSRDEVARFLLAVEDSPNRALWRTQLATGMRIGELVALRWTDVDLEQGVIAVRATAYRTQRQERTKTRSGGRRVHLDPATLALLREQRSRTRGDVVFPSAAGTQQSADNLRHRDWAAILRRAGIDHASPHALRHTMATHMLDAGVVPTVVAERLGHAHVGVTLAVYTHVLAGQHQDAARRWGDALAAMRNDRGKVGERGGTGNE